jgi:hypothetical protein
VNPRDLVHLLLTGQTLRARQWVQDAHVDWATVERPNDLDPRSLAVLAGLVEMFAERKHVPAPGWTSEVDAAPEAVYLVPLATRSARLAEQCRREAPEPLRRRRVYALDGFLSRA